MPNAMLMDEPRYVSAKEVSEKLTMSRAIEAMRSAFSDLSSGKAIVPDRQPVHTSLPTHYLVMPAHFPSGGITMVKSVSLNPENPGRGMPFIQALILVFDDETGRPLAVVDGSQVTAIRTAAASGLATDLFANPESRVGAVFGTGALAKPHVEALLAVRPIEEVLVFGSSFDKAEAFCHKWQSDFDISLVAAEDLKALQQADVICTTTTAQQPLFEHHNIKKGAHINAVGVYKPDCQEIPAESVAACKVFVDQVESALAEAGDLLVPMSKGVISRDHFRTEIGEVILGAVNYRWSNQSYTLFKSVGNAIQDAAAVTVILENINE